MENLATLAAIAGGALYFLTRKKADTATTTSTPAQSTVTVAPEVLAVTPVRAAPRIVVHTDGGGEPEFDTDSSGLFGLPGVDVYIAAIVIDGELFVLPVERFASLWHMLHVVGVSTEQPNPNVLGMMTADLDAMVAAQGLDATIMLLKQAGKPLAEAQKMASRQRAVVPPPQALTQREMLIVGMKHLRDRLSVTPPSSPVATALRARLADLANQLGVPQVAPDVAAPPQYTNYMPTGYAPATAPSLTLNVPKFTNLTLAKIATAPTYTPKQTSPVTTYATPTTQTVTSGPSLAYTTTTTPKFSIKPTTTTNLTYRR
jgi:hypothetical protein